MPRLSSRVVWTLFCTLPLAAATPARIHFEPAGPAFEAEAPRYLWTVGRGFLRMTPRTGGAPVTMRLAGAVSRAPRALEPTGGQSHYYEGPDLLAARTGVPHVSRVRWTGVYPAIDVDSYAAGNEIEYDFLVRPGGEPGRIRMSFGPDRPKLSADGELLFLRPEGVIRHRQPLAHQMIGGKRVTVPVRYHIAKGEVTFALGRYRRDRLLVIDPRVAYSTYVGSSYTDRIYGVAIDMAGFAYVTGVRTSAPNTYMQSFVSKLDPQTGSVLYTTNLGAELGHTRAFSIAVDAGGYAYIAASTGASLPVPGAVQAASGGGEDLYIARLSPTGQLVFATYFGGSGNETPQGHRTLHVEGNGVVTVAGTTTSGNLPLKNAAQSSLRGAQDAFLVRIDMVARAVLFSTYLGGSGEDRAAGLGVAADGRVFVVGKTNSTDFPTLGPLQPGSAGGWDAFLARFDAGGALQRSTYFGSASDDELTSVYADGGDALVSGTFGGATGLQQSGGFVGRFGEGGGYQNLRTVPGWNARAVVADATGNVLAAGYTGAVLQAPQGIRQQYSGGQDGYWMKIGPGGSLLYASYWGGTADDYAMAVATNGTAALLGGYTLSTDMYTGNGAQRASGGLEDGFVAKVSDDGNDNLARMQVDTTPAGLPFSIDGQGYQGSAAFYWQVGSAHSFRAARRQIVNGGTYVLNGASGDLDESLQMPPSDLALRLVYVAAVRITTQVLPANAGTIQALPASGDGLYPGGAPVTLTATAAAGYQFVGWTGAANGTAATIQLAPTGNLQLTATFQPTGGSVEPPPSGNGFTFVPLTPCRLFDGVLERQASKQINVAGQCGVPTGATAYALNVAVRPEEPLAYLTVWPTGQPFPPVSTLNSFDAQAVANAAIVPAGTGGAVSAFVTGRTRLTADISGYFVPTGGMLFYPVAPCRLVDTRTGSGFNGSFGAPALDAGAARQIAVTAGTCGIPAQARAIAINATAVPRGPLGQLRVSPKGTAPLSPTVHSSLAQIRANAAIVALSSDGGIAVDASERTDFLIDINGYFAPAGTAAGGLKFTPVAPCRAADTRTTEGFNGAFGPPLLAAAGNRTFPLVQGRCGLPAGARAWSLNVTVVPPGPMPFLTLWPAGTSRPSVSTLNAFEGQILANAAIIPAAANGAIEAFAYQAVELILDVNGYFAP